MEKVSLTIKVTKRYKEIYVDIKDYERQQAIDDKESIIILHDGKKMTLTPKQVKWGVKEISQQVYKNQVEGRPDYKTISYLWIPDEEQ